MFFKHYVYDKDMTPNNILYLAISLIFSVFFICNDIYTIYTHPGTLKESIKATIDVVALLNTESYIVDWKVGDILVYELHEDKLKSDEFEQNCKLSEDNAARISKATIVERKSIGCKWCKSANLLMPYPIKNNKYVIRYKNTYLCIRNNMVNEVETPPIVLIDNNCEYSSIDEAYKFRQSMTKLYNRDDILVISKSNGKYEVRSKNALWCRN